MKIYKSVSWVCSVLGLLLTPLAWATVIAEDNFDSGVKGSVWKDFAYVYGGKASRQKLAVLAMA